MALTDEQLEEVERLKQKFNPKDGKKINRAKFARDNKFPGGDTMINQHLKGIRPISADAALAYSKGFNCSLDEISPRLAHEARKLAASLDYEDVVGREFKEQSAHEEDSVSFNVLDVKAACGCGIVNCEYPEIIRKLVMPIGEAQRLIGSTNRNGNIQIIIASKDSMIPTIYPEDLLFVDTSVKDYIGEAVYILLHGGELVCKRISLVGKEITVSSDNQAYPSWSWCERPDETSIVGKVIRVLPMNLKKFGTM